MFSITQKRELSDSIQALLRSTNHPELPGSEIEFTLRVKGRESWSWAQIENNAAVPNPSVNPWNESNSGQKVDVTG